MNTNLGLVSVPSYRGPDEEVLTSNVIRSWTVAQNSIVILCVCVCVCVRGGGGGGLVIHNTIGPQLSMSAFLSQELVSMATNIVEGDIASLPSSDIIGKEVEL